MIRRGRNGDTSNNAKLAPEAPVKACKSMTIHTTEKVMGADRMRLARLTGRGVRHHHHEKLSTGYPHFASGGVS